MSEGHLFNGQTFARSCPGQYCGDIDDRAATEADVFIMPIATGTDLGGGVLCWPRDKSDARHYDRLIKVSFIRLI